MAFKDIFKISNIKALNYVLEKENDVLKNEIKQLKNSVAQKSYMINQLEMQVSEQDARLKSIYPLSDMEMLKVPNMFETMQKLWLEWDPSIHQTEPQLARQERAASVLLSPLKINAEHGSGNFKGEDSDYYTTLKKCECMDHQRRILPCKHMYRLAYELDVFMIDGVQYDPNVKNLLRLSDIRNITAHLNGEKKEILYKIITNNGGVFEFDSNIKSLISQGLIQESVNKREILNHYKRDTLYNLLSQNQEIHIAKSIKKSELVEIILNNYPEIVINLEKIVTFMEPHKNIRHLIPSMLDII